MSVLKKKEKSLRSRDEKFWGVLERVDSRKDNVRLRLESTLHLRVGGRLLHPVCESPTEYDLSLSESETKYNVEVLVTLSSGTKIGVPDSGDLYSL